MQSLLYKLYRFAGSLKLAVFVIVSLAGTLAVATFYESLHGTKAVQAVIYRSNWFAFILVLLGINIFFSAVHRFPWKKHQIGFAVAHTGILVILFGSLITRQFGIDGSLPLLEGETSNIVSIDEPQFEIWDINNNRWVSRQDLDVQDYKPKPGQTVELDLESSGNPPVRVLVHESLDRAVPSTSFEESNNEMETPALLVEIFSDATGIRSQQWLKANHPEWGRQTMGLAEVSFAYGASPKGKSAHGHESSNPNRLQFLADSTGNIRYRVFSSQQGDKSGNVALGKSVVTGWRDFQFRVLQYRRHAVVSFEYAAPVGAEIAQTELPAALKVSAVSPSGNSSLPRWLGYGDSAELTLGENKYLFRYGPRLISVPFALKLLKFELGKYPGTDRAMTYASRVQLIDPSSNINRPEHITMNEPLTHKDFTFYQASYQDTPQGMVSVFSVGRDPGRTAKYFGSILLVLGIIIMYTYKWFLKRRATA